MLSLERTVLILLAAGRSSRFGAAGHKLEQDVFGRPLGLHAALTLGQLPFRERVAVIGPGKVPYERHGFRCIRNAAPEDGMAGSVRLGVRAAEELHPDAVLIALADMPRVAVAHLTRLFEAWAGAMSIVASSDGRRVSPPALFGRERFAELSTLSGDVGARDLLRGARVVMTTSGEMADVDTPEDLARLRVGQR